VGERIWPLDCAEIPVSPDEGEERCRGGLLGNLTNSQTQLCAHFVTRMPTARRRNREPELGDLEEMLRAFDRILAGVPVAGDKVADATESYRVAHVRLLSKLVAQVMSPQNPTHSMTVKTLF